MYVCNHQIKKEKAILSPDWDIFRLAGGIYIHNTQGGQPKFLVVDSTVYGVLSSVVDPDHLLVSNLEFFPANFFL